MRERVDVEGEADVGLRCIKDCAAAADAGIVDEDGWVPEVGADLGGDGGDGGGGAEVDLVVVDVGCCGGG